MRPKARVTLLQTDRHAFSTFFYVVAINRVRLDESLNHSTFTYNVASIGCGNQAKSDRELPNLGLHSKTEVFTRRHYLRLLLCVGLLANRVLARTEVRIDTAQADAVLAILGRRRVTALED